MSTQRTTIPLYAQVLLVVLATSTSAWVCRGLFTSGAFLPALAGAAVGGAAVSVWCARRRWRWRASMLSQVLAFTAFALYAVYFRSLSYYAPAVDAFRDLATGVTQGWAQLLTTGLPADPSPHLVMPLAALAWIASAAGATLAVRTPSLLSPLAGPVVSFAAALCLIARLPGQQVGTMSAFLVIALVFLLLRATTATTAQPTGSSAAAPGRRRPVSLLRHAPGTAMIAATAVLGIAAAGALAAHPIGRRADVSTVYPQHVETLPALTPLATIKGQLRQNPPQPLFTIAFTAGSGRSGLIRTAALDAYDGATWTATGSFLVAGSRLPADHDAVHREIEHAEIAIGHLPGQFLPQFGWPEAIAAAPGRSDRFGFDATSGLLVTDASSLDGLTYTLTAGVGVPQPGDTAVPSGAADFDQYRRLPAESAAEFATIATQLTGKAATGYDKLTALQNYLRTLPYSLDARPGHSYAVLQHMLTATERPEQAAYGEQHAAAFAVLARTLGMPARVAVGYRLRSTEGSAPIQVTTADAYAWAEVHFDGYGWVAFDPTDTRTAVVQPPRPSPAPLLSQMPNPSQSPSEDPEPDDLATGGGDPGSGGGFDLVRPALTALIILTAMVVLLIVAIVGEKSRRRWVRRHRRDTGTRVVGAWLEVGDRLAERGFPRDPSWTPREAAQQAAIAVPAAAEQLARLADLVTAAVFGGRPMAADRSGEAWRLEARIRRALLPRWSLGRRLAARLSIAPLRRTPTRVRLRPGRLRGEMA